MMIELPKKKKIVFEEDSPSRSYRLRLRTKKKIRSLKNPKLRKIRCELRTLLHLAYRKKYGEYSKEYSKIQNNKSLTYDKRIKERMVVHRKIEDLRLNHSRYPLGCGWCSDRMEDLVFDPKRQCWFCVVCYEDAHNQYPDEYP